MGSGVLAGVVGVAVMTAAEKLEQAVTGRPDSLVPGRAAERVLGLEPDASRLRGRMWGMHVGMAAGMGALRGVMAHAGLRGPWASAMSRAWPGVKAGAGDGCPSSRWGRGCRGRP